MPLSYFIGGITLDADEKILYPAVIASGKIFTGRSHAEAQEKAIAAGAAKIEWMQFVSTDGSRTDIDLFITSKKRIIDRFTASMQRDISCSENIHRQRMPEGFSAHH